jgi:hypothetical protein
MKQIWLAALSIAPIVFAQTATPPKPGEPAPHPSFALEDPSILQGRVAKKPTDIGKSGPVPRLPDGKPDLSGPWEPNAIAANVNMKATGVEIPFTAEGAKIYKERLDRLGKDDPEARCLPPGVPRLTTTPYPFRFVQTPNYIAILYEGGTHTWRQIFMDGRGFDEFADNLWNGESIGHWEGDTLVVDTTNFTPKSHFRGSSERLHVVERFTRPDANTIGYRATVDDPDTWARSWTADVPFKRSTDRIFEYACHEGNYSLENGMRGARAEEKEKAAHKTGGR